MVLFGILLFSVFLVACVVSSVYDSPASNYPRNNCNNNNYNYNNTHNGFCLSYTMIDNFIPFSHKGGLADKNDLFVYDFIVKRIANPFTLKDVKEKYGNIHYTVLDRLAADGKLVVEFIGDTKVYWVAEQGAPDQKEIMLEKLRAGIKEEVDLTDLFYRIDKDNSAALYEEMCQMLVRKYGRPEATYGSSKCKKRGNEWLDIHHISEINVGDDNIAAKTKAGQLTSNSVANQPKNLVYCNKVEHFILHYLIENVRPGLGMGIHMIFGDILAFQSCQLVRGALPQLQQVKSFFFNDFSWEQVKALYRRLIQREYTVGDFRNITNHYLFLRGSKIKNRNLIVDTLYEIWH